MPAGCKGKYADWITQDGLTKLEGWARDGLTDKQICRNMGISVGTLCEWKNKYSELSEALKRGKAPVDQEVENALLKRALGYTYEEVTTEIEEIPTGKTDSNGRAVIKTKKHVRKTTRHVAPDTTAQIFWLKNRRPDKWREKREYTEIGTDDPLLKLLGGLNEQARSAAKQETG